MIALAAVREEMSPRAKDTGSRLQPSKQVGEIRVVRVEMVRSGLDLVFEGGAKVVCLGIGVTCKREKTEEGLQGF